MDERDKLYRKAVAGLKRESTNMKEKMKLLEKRLDFTQDENAKLAIETQALMQGVQHILNIGIKLAERERVHMDMGLGGPKDDQPKKAPKEGLYS